MRADGPSASRQTCRRETRLPASPPAAPARRAASRQPLRSGVKQTRAVSLDHLVGAGNQALRQGKTDRAGGLEIDRQRELVRRLYRQLSRAHAAQGLIDIAGSPVKDCREVGRIGQQPATRDKISDAVNCGQAVPGRELDDEIAVLVYERIGDRDDSAATLGGSHRKSAFCVTRGLLVGGG